MTTALPCPFCEDLHPVDAIARPATVTHQGISVPVTIVKRVCKRTRKSFINTRDHDYRLEARTALNLIHGNPPGTRLSGAHVTAMGDLGSVPVPAD